MSTTVDDNEEIGSSPSFSSSNCLLSFSFLSLFFVVLFLFFSVFSSFSLVNDSIHFSRTTSMSATKIKAYLFSRHLVKIITNTFRLLFLCVEMTYTLRNIYTHAYTNMNYLSYSSKQASRTRRGKYEVQ